MQIILCSVTESYDGLKFSLRINKSRKHLLANPTLQAILHTPFLQEYINKHKECSNNCY